MPDEPREYSYDDDLKRHKRELKRNRLRNARLTGENFEPRKYTARDESFARRLHRGVSIRSGGLSETD